MKKQLSLLILLVITFNFQALNASAVEKEVAIEKVKVNVDAPQGGSLYLNLDAEPATLHPIMHSDAYSGIVISYIVETLARRDLNTNEWVPLLAEKFEKSKDGKVFTFYLRKGIKFHDGKEMTAEDVKFSFDAIFEPEYEAFNLRPYFEGIQKVEIVDPYTVKFYTKDTYFKNFDIVCLLHIIPKHIYSDVKKSKKMTREIIGTGAYKLASFDRGNQITLEKFKDWGVGKTAEWKGFSNFDKIHFRFIREETVKIERLKKGDLDLLDNVPPETFVTKTEGEPFGTKVLKKKVQNKSPQRQPFIGWNLRRDMFKDKKTRKALAMLLNREEMIKKFLFDLSEPARGPAYNRSIYASEKVKALPFDPKKAKQLLADAGWKDTDKTGMLKKTIDGQKTEFKFTLLYANKENEKYWTFYKEDLKKAGIEMELKFLEFNAFLKSVDEGGFDAFAMTWSGADGPWDPKQIWHSSSAVPGGSNFIHYLNPVVDKLIDQARMEVKENIRTQKLKKVFEIIADDAPYVFLFNQKYTLYLHSAKMGMSADTFPYGVGDETWWLLK